MENSARVRVTVYAVSGIFAGIMLIYGITLPSVAMRVVGALPAVMVGLFLVFDKWAWRWWPFIDIVRRPYIGGTWAGVLTSYRRDENDRPVESTHNVVLRIEQTFVSLSVVLMTEQSKSRSQAASIVVNENHDYTVYYQYDNTPALQYRNFSERHCGGVMLDLHGQQPAQFDAEYWTNRDTKGTFKVAHVARSQVATFDEGWSLHEAAEGVS